MALEDTLSSWTKPSSDSEQEKQERTEKMVREAVDEHEAFDECSLSVYAKGSYPNNTNVRADSDVDVAVQCTEVSYWEEAEPGVHQGLGPYTGIWTPEKLRSELAAALTAKFGDQVDSSGNTAIEVNSSSARVDADVVPSFTYKYYFASGGYRQGIKIFKKSGASIKNFPAQNLKHGVTKNNATGKRYKKLVRILKRAANEMESDGFHRGVPSFFVECLTYNCPNSIFERSGWVGRTKGALSHIWGELDGSEPSNEDERWLEVNRSKFLFHSSQKWARQDGRDFAKAAWNSLGLADE